MPILWLYLFKRGLRIFLLCMFGLIGLAIAANLQEIAQFIALHSTHKSTSVFILWQILYILPMIIPISALITTTLLFRNLSNTRELIALCASGINMWQISLPLLLFSYILALLNFFITAELTPRARLHSHLLIEKTMMENPLSSIKKSMLLQTDHSYIDMTTSKSGKSGEEIALFMKSRSNEHLSLIIAKKLLVENALLMGEDVSFISYKKAANPQNRCDYLIIENQKGISTPISTLTDFLFQSREKERIKDLSFRRIIHMAFRDTGIYPRKKVLCEFYRRLHFPLMTCALAPIGIALGTKLGKERGKKHLYIPLSLIFFILIASTMAKSFDLSPIKSAFFYLFPSISVLSLFIRLEKWVTPEKER